jgi:2-polyprenyl-3-methyl-5-hydroxy-6-metoxy-1,4-benzoquinol methylase
MESIPLEKDLDWWWYRAKGNLLRHILSKENRDRYKNILEIGPGYGNNLKLLSSYGDVDILEADNSFIKYLQMNLGGEYIKSYQKLPQILNKYDLIIMLDVLEHIDESKEFMKTVNHLLKKDGLLIIGVPAYKSLWSEHDVNLKHYRRYSW